MNVGAKNHVSAAPAVPAVRAAARNKLFAAKADASASAITGLGKNFYSIDKHMGIPRKLREALRKVPLSRSLVIPSRGRRRGTSQSQRKLRKSAFAIYERRRDSIVDEPLREFMSDCEVPRRLRGSG